MQILNVSLGATVCTVYILSLVIGNLILIPYYVSLQAQTNNKTIMKRLLLFLQIGIFHLSGVFAQGWPSQYGGVMLQGFYWDSYTDTNWSNLESQADEMSQYFDLIWVPNSAYANATSNNMGYHPVYWFNHRSGVIGRSAPILRGSLPERGRKPRLIHILW